MRALLVNPPYREKVMRRYVASYFAPNFLMPPIELMSMGAVLKKWCNAQVMLIDAIAKNFSLEQCIKECQEFEPDIIISLLGFGIFAEDINSLDRIKESYPTAKLLVSGYLPTIFPEESLKNSLIDMVIMGEPEMTLKEVVMSLQEKRSLKGIQGLAFKEDSQIIINPPRPRIKELDKLPFPDIRLIDPELYAEPYLDRPIGVIMASRGCPYKCTYCVTTYGREFVLRSVSSVIEELGDLYRQGIRNIRFLDDTLTVNKNWVKDLCSQIIKQLPGVKFTCLSRVDTLDREILAHLKNAGCQRLYLGIESGSQKVLDYYKKGYKIQEIEDKVKIIKESGMEFSCFFIVGAPIEEEKDIDESISLAKRLDADYVIVTKLQYWPGTELFEQNKEKVHFSLFPYQNLFAKEKEEEKYFRWERKFYRCFYFRPRYILKRIRLLFKTPGDVLKGFIKLFGYIFHLRKNKAYQDFI